VGGYVHRSQRSVLGSSTAKGGVEGNEGKAVGETPTGATGSPKAFRRLPQLFGLQPVKKWLRNFLTIPMLYGSYLPVMRTIQMRKTGAAHGHYWGLRNAKAEGLSDRSTFFIYDTDERGLGLEENVRLCSPMFAYVRLMGKKCLRHRMVNAVQSCKMHDKRGWGLVQLAPPISKSNVRRGRASIWVERVGCEGVLTG